jgi:hypothetical protein
MAHLLQFAINVGKIPTPNSMHFANYVGKWSVVGLSSSLRFFMPAAASKMGASKSSGVPNILL